MLFDNCMNSSTWHYGPTNYCLTSRTEHENFVQSQLQHIEAKEII